MNIITRPIPGEVEQRTAPVAAAPPIVDGRKLRGIVPYGVESRDLGGFTEVIDNGALNGADLEDLIATREHDRSKLLGRHPTTLTTEDRADGFAWAVDLPSSPVGEDVRVAVERGDLRATSWRMIVAPGGERWDGNRRHVQKIAKLVDVTVTAAPAYAMAAAELRSEPDPATGQEDTMADTAAQDTTTTTTAEDRSTVQTGGTLTVEDRVVVTGDRARGLAEEFRHAGFPGEQATIPWQIYEDRAITWTGSVDNVLRERRPPAAGLGYDARWAWPAFTRVPVDEGVTSVDVPTQTARSLAAAADVIRAIGATSEKPETGSTLTLVSTPLKQVATKQSGIPNVYLEQAAFNTIVENDLRLALNDGLDKLVLDVLALSGFQAPGTDNILVSIRKAITTLRAAGYNPDTLILTAAIDEQVDTMVSGISGASADFVFAPGQFAPGTLFGLNRRVSKTIPAPAVADSAALGKLYASGVSLARFEENDGATNTSLVRLETHALFGGERTAAAVRIAAA